MCLKKKHGMDHGTQTLDKTMGHLSEIAYFGTCSLHAVEGSLSDDPRTNTVSLVNFPHHLFKPIRPQNNRVSNEVCRGQTTMSTVGYSYFIPITELEIHVTTVTDKDRSEISLFIYLATLVVLDGSECAVSEFNVKYRRVFAVTQSTTR